MRDRVRRFMDERVIPVEEEVLASRERLEALQAQARAEGLWTPHLPVELGGQGLGVLGMALLFREMGRSVVGPKVFNCDAPDQGNMDLLLAAGSAEQKERYLRPLAEGRITSAFCMTEPAPGAGSDPANLRSVARRDGDGWVLDGHKWYSTGGGRASVLVVMARTEETATLFLVERNASGVEHVRDIPVMSEPVLDHVEAELTFHGVRLGPEAVLGEVGQGFLLAQQRLVPARLTHCMRWLGLADRTLGLCRDYLATRVSFGRPLEEHQAIQAMVAEGASAVYAGNLMVRHCAELLEAGTPARQVRPFSSMAKNHVARALCRILDNAIQMHGGLGYSDDMPFARWYRWARAARIADGPDEVHTMVIARDFLKGRFDLLI